MSGDYRMRLKKSLDACGASVSALADALGVSYQAAKKVMDGKSTAFTAANNTKAARFLGVDSDWLATGEGLMRRDVTQADHWRMIADEAARQLEGRAVSAANFLAVVDLLTAAIPSASIGGKIAATVRQHLRLVA